MEDFEIDVTFSPADEAEERDAEAALKAAGAGKIRRMEEYGLSGLEIAFLAIVSVQTLVNIVIRLSRLWSTGVVVDARGSKVRTTRSTDLPSGTVIVIGKDGDQIKIDNPQEVSLQDAVRGALGAGGS